MKEKLKILANIISVIVISTVTLPILLSIFINIKFIQNLAIDYLTEIASEKIDTKVSIKRIDIGLFYEAQVEGFYVEDPIEKDTLLYVDRVHALLKSLNFKKGIQIQSVRLDSGKFFLSGDTMLNLKHVTNHLKNKNRVKKRNFKMSIDNIDLCGVDFEYYNSLRYETKEIGINYQDMRFEDIRLLARDFKISTDSIDITLDSLYFTEKSNFGVGNISANKLTLNPSMIKLSNSKLEFENSSVLLNSYSMHYSEWNMTDYINRVNMSVDIERADINFADISKFTPRKQPWGAYLSFKGKAEGTVSSMKGKFSDVTTGNTSIDSLEIKLTGIPDIKNTIFDIKIQNLNSSMEGAVNEIFDFTGREIPQLSRFNNISELSFNGEFNGTFTKFKSSGVVGSNFGSLALNLNSREQLNSTKLQGKIKTADFNIGKLFNIDKLEEISLDGDVEMLVSSSHTNIETQTTISKLQYNDYNYTNIEIDGKFIDNVFYGYLGSNDKNIDFDFNGLLELDKANPRYDFKLSMRNTDLHALNFNKRDTTSLISGVVLASGSGFQIDKINGVIEVDSLRYINTIDTINTGRITFKTANNESSKSMRVSSNFADIELRGRQSYTYIFKYLINTVKKYLPSLQMGATTYNQVIAKNDNKKSLSSYLSDDSAPTEKAYDGYYIATVNVKEANNVAGIFIPGLKVSEGTNLSFIFNPANNEFNFTFSSENISKENISISDIKIDSNSSQDSISVYAKSSEMIFNNIYIPNFKLMGGIKDDRISLESGFLNSDDNSESFLSFKSQYKRDPKDGKVQLRIDMLPSRFGIGENRWRSVQSSITMDTTSINISKFILLSDNDQSITVDGVISKSNQDTLNIKLGKLSIDPISEFSEKMGYKIAGELNGDMHFISLLKEPHLLSDISLSNIAINDKNLGDTRLRSYWDDSRKSMIFDIHNRGDIIANGAYKNSQRLLYVDFDIKDINLSLIDPFLNGISHDTKGSADMKVRLSNPAQKLRFDGTVDINNFETTIDFTNVRYSASGKVDIENNNFILADGILKDELGTICSLVGEVNGKHFKKVDYSIHAFPSNILCMNTTLKNNDLFYGRIFGSGDISIIGHGTNVVMNVAAKTDNNSTFYMPLTSKTSISEADYITFVSKDTVQIVQKEKSSFIRREKKLKDKSKGSFAMNLNINVQPNVEAQLVIDPAVGDIIKGRAAGELNIYANPAEDLFTINGGVEITRGSYLFTLRNIINKYFNIKQGSTISWSGDPLDARLNITGVYKVKSSLAPLLGNDPSYSKRVEVDCDLTLAGKLLRPDITLGISLPNSEPEVQSLVNSILNTEESISTQIFWLLFANTFSPDESINNNSMNSNLTTGAAVTGLEFISNQISNWFSTDKFNFGFSYRPKGDLTSDELELRVSTPIVKERLIFDAEGNYNFKNNYAYITDNTKTLAANLSLTWYANSVANLELKAFSRQINTFDENQGLQESGIGIYYSDEFNTFNDLLTKYRIAREARLKRKKLRKLEKKKEEEESN